MGENYDLDHLLVTGRSRLFPHDVWVNIALYRRCRKCHDRRAHATGCDLSHDSRWYCIECFVEVAESMQSADTAQSAYWNPVIGFTRRVLRGEFVAIDSDPDGIAELHIDHASDGWLHSVTNDGSSSISPSLIAHWKLRCSLQSYVRIHRNDLPVDSPMQLTVALLDTVIPRHFIT